MFKDRGRNVNAVLLKTEINRRNYVSDHIYSNAKIGNMQLKNRIVMAPMTRSRSPGNVPNEMLAKYYAQRAEAGLIITEGTSPSPNGLGYARIPGLFNEEQMQAWKKVVTEVHQAGSKIFLQLMHCGRVCHPDNMPAGTRILAPSAIRLEGSQMWTDKNGMQDFPEPEEMTEADIESTIAEFANSAELAIKAGFDGVEIHGANGYLVDQFINPASNQRMDNWGGPLNNRIQFALAVTKAIVKKIGAEKVGIRLSPFGVFNGMEIFPHLEDLYERLASELSKIGILYIHLVDHSSMGAPEVPQHAKAAVRAAFKGTLILSGGYDAKRAEDDLKNKRGDMFAFGRPFISNPHLVTKLKKKLPLKPADDKTFYTPGEKGYTDYPLD